MDGSEGRPTEMVLAWLAAHGHEYVGEWVALAEGEVVAAGRVREEVAAAGRSVAEGTGRRVVLVEVAGRELGPGEVWK